VSGSIEYRFYDAGQVRVAETNQFVVSVQDRATLIEAPGLPSSVGIPVRSFTFTSDGKEVFFVTTFAEPATNAVIIRLPDGRTGAKTSNHVFTINMAFAELRPEPFPPDHDGFVFLPWAAYASGAVLGDAGSGQLPALVFMGPGWDQSARTRLSAVWVKSAGSSDFPERIVEYANREVFSFTQGLRTRYGRPPIPQLYADGYTNAIYETLAWTNLGGIRLPLRFCFTKFAPKASGKHKDDLEVELTYEGHATSFAIPGGDPILMPKRLPDFTRVFDYRHGPTGAEPHVYTAEKGGILTLNEILQMERLGQSQMNASRYILRVVLALLAIVPIAAYVRGRKRGNSVKHQPAHFGTDT